MTPHTGEEVEQEGRFSMLVVVQTCTTTIEINMLTPQKTRNLDTALQYAILLSCQKDIMRLAGKWMELQRSC